MRAFAQRAPQQLPVGVGTVRRMKIPTPSSAAPGPIALAGHVPGTQKVCCCCPHLGDFDSLEEAEAWSRLQAAGMGLLAIGCGAEAGAGRFCAHTACRGCREVDAAPERHRALERCSGLAHCAGTWPSLLLLCLGLGSPGTLAEVLRAYTGAPGLHRRPQCRPALAGAAVGLGRWWRGAAALQTSPSAPGQHG